MVKEKKMRSGRLRLLSLAAILAAMSIVLGKYLQIPNPVQDLVRISFENLPVIFAGIVMGPVMGAAVGVVADLVGCLMVGYTPIPLVTLGAALVGALAGLSSRYLIRKPLVPKVVLAVFLAHGVGSVVVKTWGLAEWYAARYGMGFLALMGWRGVTYAVIAVLEGSVICVLLQNRALTSLLERMCKRK